jgi:1-acyl-sn-glycerol-3-phosphate acyltransferase
MRSILFWVVTIPSSAFFSTVSIVGSLVRAPRTLHDWVHRNWSRSLLWAAGVKVVVRGLDNVRRDGPQIFISNHQSMFDIFAIFASLPASVRFVAKKELGRIPVFAQAMRAAGHVFIDRKDRKSATREMRAAAERMKREHLSLGLFPEGTRSRDGELHDFKKGTFVLAIETQVPIVPLAVDGGFRIASGGKVRPGTINLQAGPAIPMVGRTAADRDEVLARVRSAVSGMITAAREGRPSIRSEDL